MHDPLDLEAWAGQGVGTWGNDGFGHWHRGAAIRTEDVTDGGAVIRDAFGALIHAGGAQVDRGQTEEEDPHPAPHEAVAWA